VEIEGNKAGVVPVKLVANVSARKEMTNIELNQEFRELNAAQMKVNTRAAIGKLTGGEVNRKKDGEKDVTVGKRMMRAEDATVVVDRLPSMEIAISLGSQDSVVVERDQTVLLENKKSVKEKKIKKSLAIPESVVEEMELEKGEDEFGIDQRTEVLLEGEEETLTGQGVGGGPVEDLSVTFLQNILSEGMKMGEEYDIRGSEAQEFEETGGGAETEYISSRDLKEELIEMARDDRKEEDGKRSSESTEETERIVIEDSSEGDSFMVRGVGLQYGVEVDAEQPEPPGEISTPPRGESTPIVGQVL